MTKTTDPDIRLLRAVADPTRLAILRQLSVQGPRCARDLSDCCGDLSQPTVSHHLKILRQAGWIDGEPRGTWIWYSIRPQAVGRFSQICAGIGAGRSQPLGTPAPPAGSRRDLRVLEPSWRQW